MSSSEYHKCMSEVYFTKALVWMAWINAVLRVQQNETRKILAVMCAILSVVYFARSYREFREANHG